ncbi:MAG TPA: helix-turn-helix domain-containing protein [Pirellula sp.]|nr:helix-turn-helix domain-containing protein [Pirellula sp.]
MKKLNSILDALSLLRNHPDPDESIFVEAAAYVRAANNIAILKGVEIVPVGSYCSLADAATIVSKYIGQIQPEWLTVPEAATLLAVSQSKVADWVKAERLEAINVAARGKRASYRIHRTALSKLKPECQPVRQSRRVKPPEEII